MSATATERLAGVLVDLQRRELAAASRNKVTLWAYYQTARLALAEVFEDCVTDEAIQARAVEMTEGIEDVCRQSNDEAIVIATTWSLGIYCRRIADTRSRPSLAWLRERVGVRRPAVKAQIKEVGHA